MTHGFIGKPGDFNSFDAPVAISTFVASGGYNPADDGVRGYPDSANVYHGFVRYSDGTIVGIDAPGSASTFIASINSAGRIAGFYFDNDHTLHGLVRTANGTVTPFDAPGAGAGNYRGTFTSNINPSGMIVETYVDDRDVAHGYLRTAVGQNHNNRRSRRGRRTAPGHVRTDQRCERQNCEAIRERHKSINQPALDALDRR